MYGQTLAILAGLCAASASICAKLAMLIAFENEESSHANCRWLLSHTAAFLKLEHDWTATNWICETMIYYVGIGFFGLVFVFNALMWIMFVKSLQKCTSSIQATVTNAAANFFFSAVMGWLMFGESLSLLWWAGSTLIVIGLLLIHRGSPPPPEANTSQSTVDRPKQKTS